MTNNTTDIATRVASLPALPTVWAASIYAAQGLKLKGDERAAVIARADFFESLGMSRKVKLDVVNPATNVREGVLEVTI